MLQTQPSVRSENNTASGQVLVVSGVTTVGTSLHISDLPTNQELTKKSDVPFNVCARDLLNLSWLTLKDNMNARTAFLLLFTGLICSFAGCTKPVVVGELYVLSASMLATSDEENAMVLNNAKDDKDLQNKYRRLQGTTPVVCGTAPCDAVAFLDAGTVIRVLRVHDGKVGRFVFVEIVHDRHSVGDIVGFTGHRYWIKARHGLFKRIDEWSPG